MYTKNKFSKNESGQAIILIVFAIVGLIALTALTVDGSNAYSNRRHAQNAADTAAFAAALSNVRHESWKVAALEIASQNGFTDDFPDNTTSDTHVNVEVYGCNEATPNPRPEYAECGVYEGSAEYLVVVITSKVDTYFAPIIGIQQVTNRVKAIARAKPDFADQNLLGDAMISFMQGCKGDETPNWPHDPFTVSGGPNAQVNGSGVFVNSSCDSAYTENGGGAIDLDPGENVCVIGTSDSSSTYVEENCSTPLAYPPLKVPNPSCASNGAVTGPNGGPYVATPGHYSGSFPPSGPSGDLLMQSGIYCIDDDFSPGAGWNITSASGGILIRVETGGITINGNTTLNLQAMSGPEVPVDIKNLLFFVPLENDSTVKINGGTENVNLTGTILAPASHCIIAGSTGTTINSQILCYTIAVDGNAGLTINYNETQNMIIQIPPSIELTQ